MMHPAEFYISVLGFVVQKSYSNVINDDAVRYYSIKWMNPTLNTSSIFKFNPCQIIIPARFINDAI